VSRSSSHHPVSTNLLAAARATLAADRDGENDPLFYVPDELAEHGQLTPAHRSPGLRVAGRFPAGTGGLVADRVDLLAVAVDQRDPGPLVGWVAAFGLLGV
jgi:hypothetical protein